MADALAVGADPPRLRVGIGPLRNFRGNQDRLARLRRVALLRILRREGLPERRETDPPICAVGGGRDVIGTSIFARGEACFVSTPLIPPDQRLAKKSCGSRTETFVMS